MRKKTCVFVSVIMMVLSWSSVSYAEDEPENFISSSLFMLGNFLPNPPSFYQLNYGRRLTKQDTLIVEAITWTYDAPLGIPYRNRLDDSDYTFDGYARDIGVGLAYQRFWWRGLYSTLHVTPFWQQYYNEQREYIQSGFQLFMTFRTGYHFEFWKNRLFIEPSVAVTAWPVNTNLPESFAKQEDRWPGYFLFEPGLHIGVNF